MNLLELIAYLSRAYNLPMQIRVDGGEWEVAIGANEQSLLRGKGKTPAEALAKIFEIR